MHSATFTYKHGDHGEPLSANVHWTEERSDAGQVPKPICIILHGGGMTVGSNAIVPASQISYLASLNFVVVVPNYRLCPQVSALDGAFADTASVLVWCRDQLPGLLADHHHLHVDSLKLAAMGHSIGGTLALWLSTQRNPPTAIASFYPCLYLSSTETSAHKPYRRFAAMPDYEDTKENNDALFNLPSGEQISAFPMALPGQPPQPRNAWLFSHLKNGTWPSAAQPDGNLKAIDPCVRFSDAGPFWPPTIFVQGDEDDLPGSSLEYVERAIEDLKQAGASRIRLEKVEGESHMFDMQPDAAVGRESRKSEAVKAALDFLTHNV